MLSLEITVFVIALVGLLLTYFKDISPLLKSDLKFYVLFTLIAVIILIDIIQQGVDTKKEGDEDAKKEGFISKEVLKQSSKRNNSWWCANIGWGC